VRVAGLTLHGDPDDSGRVRLHASGHAPGPKLLEFVETVRPKTLIPIHTEHPEWWAEQLAGTDILIKPPVVGQGMRIG